MLVFRGFVWIISAIRMVSMFGLMDDLDSGKWVHCTTDERGDGFVEFYISKMHSYSEPTVITFHIREDDGIFKLATIHGTKEYIDPLDGVVRAYIKLDTIGTTILGIDIEGDCVVIKSQENDN